MFLHFEFSYAKTTNNPILLREIYFPLCVLQLQLSYQGMPDPSYHGHPEHQRGDEVDGGLRVTGAQLVERVEKVRPTHDPKEQAEHLGRQRKSRVNRK